MPTLHLAFPSLHPLVQKVPHVFREKGWGSPRKQITCPKVAALTKIRRNSVSLPPPLPAPFPSHAEAPLTGPPLLFPPGASSGGGRLVQGKESDPEQNARAPGSARIAHKRATLAAPGRAPPARGVWGPLAPARRPRPRAGGGREPAALPAALRVPGRLAEPRARGGATRDWPRGVGGGPSAGRPGGRRQ